MTFNFSGFILPEKAGEIEIADNSKQTKDLCNFIIIV